MEYQNFNIENKDDINSLLSSNNNEDIIKGLIGMINGIDDYHWILEKLYEFAHHKDFWVAKTSINGMADVIRIHKDADEHKIVEFVNSIEREELDPIISDLKDDIKLFRK